MAIFAELAPNECIIQRHLHVKGENVIQRYPGSGARDDAKNSLALGLNSLALARTRFHSLARPLVHARSSAHSLKTPAAVSCDHPPVCSHSLELVEVFLRTPRHTRTDTTKNNTCFQRSWCQVVYNGKATCKLSLKVISKANAMS